MTSLATSLPVAQWLERPTGVREVMGSIPVGDSDFFFVPRSWQSEYSIFLRTLLSMRQLHPGLVWSIFPILTREGIDDVISRFYTVVC